MTRYLPIVGLAAALLTACAPDPEPYFPIEESRLLEVEVEAPGLDPARVRVGVFEAQYRGSYRGADGPHTATIILSAHVADGDRVTIGVREDEQFVDLADVRTISMAPLADWSLSEVQASGEIELPFVDLVMPSGGDFDTDGVEPWDEQGEAPVVTLLPVVWYDANGDGRLDLDLDGESETLRAFTFRDGDRDVTLSLVEFTGSLVWDSPEAGEPSFDPTWTVWGTDAIHGPHVPAGDPVWTAELPSATERRER